MGAASTFLPTNPIIPHIDKISSLFRSIALGGSDKQRRICPVSGTVPGPLFRGLPRTLLPGSRGRARPRRGIRRIFDGGALGAPTLPSPRYPAAWQGHGAFSRRGSLPRASFPSGLCAFIFAQYSVAFVQHTVHLLSPAAFPGWEMPVLYHTSAPLTSPGFVNFSDSGRRKRKNARPQPCVLPFSVVF